MSYGQPTSQVGSNTFASQSSDKAFVSRHSHHATFIQSIPNAQNTPHYANYGHSAYPSANYPGSTPGSMTAYGLPVFPPPSYPQLYGLPDPAPCIRKLVQIPPNALIHLSSLIDEPVMQSRPSYSMKQLAAVAIYSSRDGKANVQEIGYAIMARFAYFRTDNNFMATLRGALSLNDLFSQPKPSPHEPLMKGGFWVVDARNPEGHRPRKRGNPSRPSDDTNSDVSS
ncbi:hypothetical protein IW261DRAFT_1595651 [Armillaria novae-zelandiae]|uniref:Fork-head domain-containing protein n=1 Tax=Armillaria novae-zelandiae TaxID=153914 RepID=A0AA39P107_9AGAR|nr:hypothetical protein IW261DRAFT_1595651 [Armillaria novae-zelandiae]